MKTVSISAGILLSLLLLVNFCAAEEKNVAELQPGQEHFVDARGEMAKNGEEAQEEKFRSLPRHKPFYKKPFVKPLPHPSIVKKPIPHHPVMKKPSPNPHDPPVFPNNP